MSSRTDAEFLRLLRQDLDYFTGAIERFEGLLPEACSALQDQWRLQAQSRKNFTLDLQILMEKAERCVQLALRGAREEQGRESAFL
jgi:hypothetical protein